MKVQIDREAFDKYQQNERDKVIFMHKLIIYFFIIINVICVVFIFLLKSNSLSIRPKYLMMKWGKPRDVISS